MAQKQMTTNTKRNMVLALLLFLAAGAVVAFQADYIHISFAKKAPTYSSELLSMINVDGAVKVKDLNLSSSEIRKINYAAMKMRRVFSQIDVSLNMEDKFAPIEVGRNTELELGLVFKAGDDCEVQCWTQSVSRSRLVAQVVRSMEEARIEYEKLLDHPELKRSFKRLYL